MGPPRWGFSGDWWTQGDVQKGRQPPKNVGKCKPKSSKIPHYFNMKELYNRFGKKRGDQLWVWCPCDPNLKEILCITLYDLYGNPQNRNEFPGCYRRYLLHMSRFPTLLSFLRVHGCTIRSYLFPLAINIACNMARGNLCVSWKEGNLSFYIYNVRPPR